MSGADGSTTPPTPSGRQSVDKGSHAKMKEALQALEKSTRLADMFNGGNPCISASRRSGPHTSL